MSKLVNMTLNVGKVEMFNEVESEEIIDYIESKRALKIKEDVEKGLIKEMTLEEFKKVLDNKNYV